VEEPSGGIQPISGPPSVTLYNVRYAAREVTVHQITDSELDSVASLSNSVHLALFGLCAGGLITLVITLLTVPIAQSMAFAALVASSIATFVGTIYFGINARIAYKEAERKVKEIKQPLA
jgi:hypothetical protein